MDYLIIDNYFEARSDILYFNNAIITNNYGWPEKESIKIFQ